MAGSHRGTRRHRAQRVERVERHAGTAPKKRLAWLPRHGEAFAAGPGPGDGVRGQGAQAVDPEVVGQLDVQLGLRHTLDFNFSVLSSICCFFSGFFLVKKNNKGGFSVGLGLG